MPHILVALQFALAPPLTPAHVQVQGQVPPTVPALPAEQRLVVGLLVDVVVLPHIPSTAVAVGVHQPPSLV
jgi:hypothetical protein